MGCFTLLECSKCLGVCFLHLPTTPKCGKTCDCPLPSMKHLVLCVLGIDPSFPDKMSEFLLASGLLGFVCKTFNQVFCLPSNFTDFLTWFLVVGNFVRIFSLAPQIWNVKLKETSARLWEVKK